SEKDIYIHSSDLSSAMNNDKVIVRIEKRGQHDKRTEGVVIRVVERTNHEIVGTFEKSKSFGFVIAEDQRFQNDIFISKNKNKCAVTGHKVLVSITKFPKGRKSGEGEVIKILGHKNDPGIDILSIIYKHGLKLDFPENVLNEAAQIPEQVTVAEINGRRDLRDKQIVTIDDCATIRPSSGSASEERRQPSRTERVSPIQLQ